MMRLPSGNSISSTCGLMLFHLRLRSARDLDLRVEVADVADDGAVAHLAHVVEGDDVDVAGAGDEDVGARRGVVHRRHFVTFHRRLQRADRIDLGHHHAAAGVAQDAAEPLPTSPKPATIATLPAIITSVPRRMPSTSDSRQP